MSRKKTKTVQLRVKFKRYEGGYQVVDPRAVTDVGPTARKRVSGGYKDKTCIYIGGRKIAVEHTQEEVLDKLNWETVA